MLTRTNVMGRVAKTEGWLSLNVNDLNHGEAVRSNEPFMVTFKLPWQQLRNEACRDTEEFCKPSYEIANRWKGGDVKVAKNSEGKEVLLLNTAHLKENSFSLRRQRSKFWQSYWWCKERRDHTSQPRGYWGIRTSAAWENSRKWNVRVELASLKLRGQGAV